MAASQKYRTVIVWMRRDLRVCDNAALAHACEQAENVIPLFVLDEAILKRPDTGAARVVFLADALRVLDSNLRRLGGRLIVRRGRTPDTLVQAAQEMQAEAVFFHREYEPHGRARDEEVSKHLAQAGIAAETFKDLVLFEPEEILTQSGTAYSVFSPYKRVWLDKKPDAPYEKPAQVHVPEAIQSEELPEGGSISAFSTSQTFACGGEDAASALLDEFITNKMADYGLARDVLADEGTSRLSRHLHFGTISPRTIYEAVRQAQKGRDWKTIESSIVFLTELAWREFYLQILWNAPYAAEGAYKREYDAIEWENDAALFAAWQQGRTGYPIVDAAMRQMNAEAWMHNRGRMIVASFLTKDLLIDWRWGERYFMEKLVDGDQAANNGGWQWAAGTGTDAQPYFRIFNPTSQGVKFDPMGTYVKRWIPELAQVPAKVIHTPWKLSETERQHLGCQDYPSPIVDHAIQRERALTLYRKALKDGAL